MIDRLKKNLFTEIKKYWIVWAIALVLFFLFWLFLYERYSFFTSPKKLEYTAAGQNYSDEAMGNMTKSTTVSQTFVSARDSLSRIQLPFHLYTSKPSGSIELQLKEAVGGKVMFEKTVPLSGLKDGKLTSFDFQKINGVRGKRFVLTIKGSGLQNGKSVSLWKSTADHYPQGKLYINGRQVSGDLRFSIFDMESRTLIGKTQYIMAAAVFLLLFILSVPVLKKYRNELHKAFLVTAIPIGLLLVVIVPPFDQLDEFDHFLRSFEVSEGMFVNQVTSHGMGNYIPSSLVDTIHKTQFISGSGYQYGIAGEAFSTPLNPSERVFIRNYASSYPPTIYIPQAIGLWGGRLLFHSPMMMMYLGRFVNLLAYVIIVYFGLKIVPVKKKLFYIMALLPMSINQASSLSGDSMIISSAFLFSAYILYLAYGQVGQVTRKHVWTTIAIGIFIGVSKIVYFPMVLLFFLIPLRKFIDKKDYLRKFLFVFLGFLIPYLMWNWLNLANLSIPDVRTHSGVMPKEQVSFILSHPIQYLKVLIDSFIHLGESKFLGMLGTVIVIYHYSTPDIVIYTFLFLMVLFGLMSDETDLEFLEWKKADKPLMVFVMLAVTLLVYTALYAGFTPVGYSVVLGIQGRYFIPVAIFLFLSLSNHQFIIKNKHVNFLVAAIIHSCMYAALFMYIIQINTY